MHGADEQDPKTIQEMVAEAGERVTGIAVDNDNGAWITGGEFPYFFALPFSGRLLK